MRPSLLKTGVILLLIGAVWTGLVMDHAHLRQDIALDAAQTDTARIYLDGGIGFYRVNLPEPRDSVFVQVLDPRGNVISDKKLGTLISVNYFDVSKEGTHTLKVTNLAENPISVGIHAGQLNPANLAYPGAALVIGAMLVVAAVYVRLQNYAMAQPEEKIS